MSEQIIKPHSATFLATCPDGPGLIASIAQLLYKKNINIIASDQYSTDHRGGQFFMRMVLDLNQDSIDHKELEKALAEVANSLNMRWQLTYSNEVKRLAILVSRYDHCLMDLLWRWQSGELAVTIPFVISNHLDLKSRVESFGIPYYHFPITPEIKSQQEAEILSLLKDKVDFIVLARYMQILSASFIEHYPNKIINIHHSFLPAFMGANPFAMAHKRGVKMIGATGHYVTSDLDAGPIIAQDVTQISHRDTVEDLKRTSRDTERTVLARAVRWHIEDRIIVDGNRTIIFT
ncbi:MAG: formyltetrahydrofolate deformylase [Blastocatellia bacterium]|nr:formyltetrahydrofolate deformylase [Blastocatellia bacterium]MBN8721394.1 formyltetrahydrofolate deformylase [Acidobacteriota bacterium]